MSESEYFSRWAPALDKFSPPKCHYPKMPMARPTIFAGVIILHTILSAQTRPTFDVASVKPNNSKSGATSLGFQPSGRFRAVNEPLWRLIAEAYRTTYQLRQFDIVGLPDWIADERYDVEAVPEGVPGIEEQRLMLQNLLADRFKLAMHREPRETPIYNLEMRHADGQLGPRLERSQVDCAAMSTADRLALPASAGQARPCVMVFGQGHISAAGMTIAHLAEGQLSRYLGRPVVNRTGLTGPFTWDMDWTPGLATDAADLDAVSIFTAVQEQLGLRLEATKARVEILVIDHVARPTPD